MARQIVVLALVLIALVGLVSAANAAPAAPSPRAGAAAAPVIDNDTIGNTDEAVTNAPSNRDAAVAGPIGSEEEAKKAIPAAQPPASGATTLSVSAVAGAAAIAGYFVF